jgi:hypothetical protein
MLVVDSGIGKTKSVSVPQPVLSGTLIDSSVKISNQVIGLDSPVISRAKKPINLLQAINDFFTGTNQQTNKPYIPVTPISNNTTNWQYQQGIDFTNNQSQVTASKSFATPKARQILSSIKAAPIPANTNRLDEVHVSARTLIGKGYTGNTVNLASVPYSKDIQTNSILGSSIGMTNEPNTPLTVAVPLTGTDTISDPKKKTVVIVLVVIAVLYFLFKHKRHGKLI